MTVRMQLNWITMAFEKSFYVLIVLYDWIPPRYRLDGCFESVSFCHRFFAKQSVMLVGTNRCVLQARKINPKQENQVPGLLTELNPILFYKKGMLLA